MKKDSSGKKTNMLKRLLSPRLWRKITSVQLVVVVFVTTYMMILPAISIDIETVIEEPGMDVEASGSSDIIPADLNEIIPDEATDMSSGETTEPEIHEEDPSGTSAGELISSDEFGENVSEASLDLSENITEDLPIEEQEIVEDAAEPAEELALDEPMNAIEFERDNLLTYDIMGTVIEKNVLASDGHNYRVVASYGPEAGIPENAELMVEEILPPAFDDTSTSSVYDEYVSKTENALGMEEGSAGYIRLFDISIVDKNDHSAKYQPAPGTMVDVHIELTDSESENLSVVHFADDENAGEKIESQTETTNRGQTVSFEATGFSVYAIINGDPSTGETYSIKYTFVLEDGTPFYFTNKNGDTTNIQYVKDGEIPLDPGTPTVSTGEQPDKEFVGWWTKDGTSWGTELSFDTPVSTSSMQEITVYARYDNTQYVTYYDENGTVYLVDRRHENDTVLTTDIKNKATGEKWTEEELEEYRFVAYQPLHKTTAFLGWTATPGKTTPDDNFTITEATTLYPVIAEVKWVTYHSGPIGSNATYFGAEYALDGNWERNNLTDRIPTRAGYRFDGWYIRNPATQGDDGNLDYSWTVSSADVRVTDANGNFSSGFRNNSAYFENGKLKNDIELVAHWTPTTVDYVFVYYQQEPNANADGTYNYVYKDSVPARGTAGTNTGTPPVPNWDDIAGFSLHNTSESSDPYNVKTEVIEGDGSTVVNVYYDRNEYTISFHNVGYVRDNTNGSYVLIDGDYLPAYYLNYAWYYMVDNPSKNATVYTYFSDIGITRLYWNSRNNYWYYTYRNRSYQYTGSTYLLSAPNQRYSLGDVGEIDELTITAKYGEDVSQLWPDKRTDLSADYPQQWYTSINGSVMQSGIQTMPPNNQVFYNRENTGVENHLVYLLQDLPSDNESIAPNTFTSVRNDLIYGNSLSTTWDDYSIYEGFKVNIRTQDVSTLNNNNGADVATTNNNYSISAQIGSSFSDGPNNTLNIYYLRNKYTVTFQQGNTVIGSDEYYYEADISDADKYSSAVDVPPGMRFVGWYDNPEGIGGQYTFDGKTMPPNNLILYAKLVPEEYYVRLDYNGGETKGSEGTFAWVDYGETIEEAEAVKRNYVEAADGETGTHNYIYWRYDEAADAAGEGWWSYYEDADGNIVYNDPKDYSRRTATYVEAPGGKYKYDPSKYTFVGWYETDEEGNQISNVPFNFATQITKDTYLKAVFRKEGTIQVRYLPDMGTEGTEGYVAGDPNTAPPTDSYTYIDLSEAKVGHSIEPADKRYQFAGWRVKGTTDPVYQPGETFPINSDYAEEENNIQYITMEPVFIHKEDTSITYEVNTPDGGTVTGTALKDLMDNTQDKLVLNSSVTLHDGAGFAVTGYKLIGWSDKPLQPAQNPIHLKDDGTYEGPVPSDTHIFKLGGTYGVSDEAGNTLYAVWDSNRIEFTKSVSVEGTLTKGQVNHTIYIALTKGDKESYVLDPDGNILVKEIRIINGVPTPETVTFDGLEDGNYNVWELKSADGHRLGVSDVFPIQGANPAANFAVKSISGNNNATVENCSTAETALTNTYAKEDDTPIRFEANKVWIDRRANEIAAKDMPENATATLSLYRKINGQVEASPIGSVTLDGHIDETEADFMEDEPWHASFGNLPRFDEHNNRITYVVKETAATPDGYYPWKQKSQNNDAYGPNDYLETSGGTIYNRKLTMTVQVQKHFDFQPNNGDEKAETYAAFAADTETRKLLTFDVTLPTGTEHLDLSQFHEYTNEQGSTTFLYEFEDVPYYLGLYPENGDESYQIIMKEYGEQDLLKAYNYYIWHIEGYEQGNTNWDISSGNPVPDEIISTRTVSRSINADDQFVEVRIQNKYRRGSEGEFEKIKKKVIGLSEEDFNANLEMLRNLHFVIQNDAGYYAGQKATPVWNPETKRYEKLDWVSDIAEAIEIAPQLNYSVQDNAWIAEVNLSGFNKFPSGTYTLVEKEALNNGPANIDGYRLEVLDNTIEVETHEEDSNWQESFKYTLSITNQYTRIVGGVEFNKEASDKEEPDRALPGAEFTLYTDAACEQIAKNADGQNVTAVSAQGTGKVSFTNIPVGTYYMKETKAPKGYKLSTSIYQVVINEITADSSIKKYEDGSASGNNVKTIVNEPDNVKIRLLKVNMVKMEETLSGAKFTLYNEDKTEVVNDIDKAVTDESGIIDFGTLNNGTFYIHEDEAPTGYVSLPEDIRVVVTLSNAKGHQIAPSLQNSVTYDSETDTYTITVPNNPGVELPSTGGVGTDLIYLFGTMLTGFAGAGLVMKKRQRK